MAFVIRLVGLADGRFATEYDGKFLAGFRDTRDGVGNITVTTDSGEALQFATQADAFRFWQTRSTHVPVRPDGKPNRPLTAFTVEILPNRENRE